MHKTKLSTNNKYPEIKEHRRAQIHILSLKKQIPRLIINYQHPEMKQPKEQVENLNYTSLPDEHG